MTDARKGDEWLMIDNQAWLICAFFFVLAEVSAMDADMADDDPLRCQVWKLKEVAVKAIGDGMAVARQISDTVKMMKADQEARK